MFDFNNLLCLVSVSHINDNALDAKNKLNTVIKVSIGEAKKNGNTENCHKRHRNH